MDTSTLTVTDRLDDSVTAALTSAHYSDRIQPGVEWFTRLISPLTRHTADPSSPPSRLPMVVASAVPVMKEDQGTDVWETVKGVAEAYRPAAQLDQAPYPTQPQIPAPRGPETGSDGRSAGMNNMLLIFIPMLAVVLTVLLGLLVFLVAMLYMRRRRGIR